MTDARPSPFAAGIRCRCPRCGEGNLFAGYLALAPRCESCGLDYDFADAGDGPAIFIMLIVGFIVVGLALFVEVWLAPPIVVHLMLWIPLSLILSLWLLRPFKATMIALQFANDAHEGRH
ncbi:MAG TPA: DUF983 domain-containing protein [Devosiaceae bacterium]|nr:DUF983 domain-containing protein [Devosiaceae bacterium]